MRFLRFCVLVAAIVVTGACSQVEDIDFDFGIVNATTDPIKVLLNTEDVGVVPPAGTMEGTTQIAVSHSAARCCSAAPTSVKRATATFVAINTITQKSCTKEGVQLQDTSRTTVVFDYRCSWRSSYGSS